VTQNDAKQVTHTHQLIYVKFSLYLFLQTATFTAGHTNIWTIVSLISVKHDRTLVTHSKTGIHH